MNCAPTTRMLTYPYEGNLVLYMVRMAGLDGHGPIELLQEDQAA